MADFILGFSGTRYGMKPAQERTLRVVLASLNPKPAEFWHGDCIGADVQFHDNVLRTFGGHAAIHLFPSDLKSRAHCEVLYSFPGSRYTIHPVSDAASRTRYIANRSRVLIATPFSEREKGGTWLAIKTAEQSKKQIIIIWPDGHTEER